MSDNAWLYRNTLTNVRGYLRLLEQGRDSLTNRYHDALHEAMTNTDPSCWYYGAGDIPTLERWLRLSQVRCSEVAAIVAERESREEVA